MNYRQLANEYYDLIRKSYGTRADHNVRDFVKGFAYFLEKRTMRDVMSASKNGGVAVITENINHLTGGRYYTWMVALALHEAGIPVTIYTNSEPGFLDYFSDYKQPKIEIIGHLPKDLADADIKADAYIGSPINGNLAAIRNGLKYQKPSLPMIFDPLPMIDTYRNITRSYPEWRILISELIKSKTKVMTLCRSIHPYIHGWIDKSEDSLVPVYPCINSRVKNKAKKGKRGDYVVFISRLVPNKKLEHVLAACKDNRINLKIITSASGIDHRRMIDAAGMRERTEVIFNPTDLQKFEMIYAARAVINGAVFEGFGMWLAEAIACGTPAVCYQYPTFTEIRNHALAKNVYMAAHNDQKDLSRKLKAALDEQKYTDGSDAFDFERMVERMGEIYAN